MKLEWKTCIRIAVSAFFFYLCIQYWPNAARLLSMGLSAAFPLITGCIIAYLVNILMRFYEKHYFPKARTALILKSRRPVCMVAAFLTLLIIMILVVNLIVPELVSCVGVIISALPAAIDSLVDLLTRMHILPENIAVTLSEIDWQSKIGQLLNLLLTGAGTVVNVVIGTISTIFSGVVTALVGIIFSIYLLLGKDKLAEQCKRLLHRYLRAEWCRNVNYILTVLNDCFSRYIVGQCIEAIILGTLCTFGMLVLHLPYATMIGALISFTALIPVAGAYIGGAIGALMVFSISPAKALIFILFLVVLQQVEGNLIYPRVVGSSLGLPAIWVLAAVTIGGGIMGIAGMLLGVPIAATLYRLLKNDLNKPHSSNPAEKELIAELPGGNL
ncbi:MAG: AI-2E family transporter [Lachnospiraceae bacterium]